LQFGLRLGVHPQTVVTTTPRPTKIIKELIKDSDTIVTRGSTYENADNLAASTLITLQTKYADTRLGRQELFGEILDDNPGALWNRSMLETARVKEAPYLTRIVVGIDPAVTSGEDSDSTGIVVAGMSADGHYYILADYTLKASPQVWAEKAVYAFELHKADRIIAETNNGGDLVVHLLQQVKNTIPVKKVTASRGKAVRAEPIAALSEQGKLHMVGYFTELEDELCEYEPGVSAKSPDRMDAMVWAVTELSEGSNALNYLSALAVFCPNCRMPAPKSTRFCPKCNTLIGEPDAITSDKPNA
jgi:predicted phage terminase large subunit-like protein